MEQNSKLKTSTTSPCKIIFPETTVTIRGKQFMVARILMLENYLLFIIRNILKFRFKCISEFNYKMVFL